MGEWQPLICRGDGAWIGLMPDGQIGVGVEGEARASLQAAGYVPLWPFLENELSECLENLYGVWDRLEGRGFAGPETLVQETVVTAWSSGRPYWMQLSASWVPAMVRRPGFDPNFLREIIAEMSGWDALPAGLAGELRSASSELSAGPEQMSARQQSRSCE
ncbi:hypothetical protein [Kribbella lupini]|uniref:hypothetical protein n=1 Tax=Kribbella lupini TaxID=291602 RepID=UPI0031D5CE46